VAGVMGYYFVSPRRDELAKADEEAIDDPL
jgi:hypothetical protein